MTTATTTLPTQIVAEPGKLDLTIVREFNAPRELVFRAHTDMDLMGRWLGPSRLKTHWVHFEPREGGRWRYYSEDTDGSEYHFSGVFHYVNAPETIVQTFEFEGLPDRGHVQLERLTLEELPNGRTRLTARSVFLTQEDRDGMIQAGMESGVTEGYQRLDALLAGMA